MTDSDNDNALNELAIRDEMIVEQNKVIAELAKKLENLEKEMQRTKDLAGLAAAANVSLPGSHGPSLQFPPLNNPNTESHPNNISGNPPHIGSSYHAHAPPTQHINRDNNLNIYHPQNPPPNHQSTPPNASSSQNVPLTFNPNDSIPQNFTPAHQSPAPNVPNPPTTQTTPSAPFYVTTIPESYPTFPNPDIDQNEEKGEERRAVKDQRDKDMLMMKEEIARIKESRSSHDKAGFGYDDLCIHPGLDLPEGFKIPKFDTFNGTGNPPAHLRSYCDQMVGVGKNEALLMRLFSRSLSGEALEWFTSQDLKKWSGWRSLAKDFADRFAYNVEVVPDRYSLDRIRQKSSEYFRDYAYRWRKEAARVRPPMSEEEIVAIFMRAQEPEFYDKMISAVHAKFADLVKIGETVEEGLRTGKIIKASGSRS